MADQSTRGSGDDLRLRIVAEARTWIGTPYRHQASLKGTACDCLGLVRGVWRAIYGSEPEQPPAYSPDWAEGSKEETLTHAASRHMIPLPIAEAAAGDLLLFRWRPHFPAKHCAIITEGAIGFRGRPALSAAGEVLAAIDGTQEARSAEGATGKQTRIVHAYDAAGAVAEVNLAAQWRGRIAAAFAFPAELPTVPAQIRRQQEARSAPVTSGGATPDRGPGQAGNERDAA